MSKEEKEFRHQSYVLVQFVRQTGNTGRLFGSSLKNQHTSIKLRVTPGIRRHHLSHDWYGQDHEHNGGRDYLEVELSAAQFAELLTTMNIGSGVPCTLRRLNGKQIADPPDELLENEQVKIDFKETVSELNGRLDIMQEAIKKIADKKTLTQKDKEELQKSFDMARQQIQSNMPYVTNQFHEATDKIIQHAKAEVDAFMTHAVMSAGFKAIAEKSDDDVLEIPAPQLTSHPKDE